MFIGLPTTSMSKGPKGFDSPDASAKPPYFIPASTPPGAVRGKLYFFFWYAGGYSISIKGISGKGGKSDGNACMRTLLDFLLSGEMYLSSRRNLER